MTTPAPVVGYSERFYETEIASGGITEQQSYDGLSANLATAPERSQLEQLNAEGAGMSEHDIVEEALKLWCFTRMFLQKDCCKQSRLRYHDDDGVSGRVARRINSRYL